MCVYCVHAASRNSPCRSEEDSPIRKKINGPAKISIDHTYSENRYYYVLKIDFCNFLCFSTHEYNKAYDMKSNMKSSSVAGTHKREHKHMESHAPDLHVMPSHGSDWKRKDSFVVLDAIVGVGGRHAVVEGFKIRFKVIKEEWVLPRASARLMHCLACGFPLISPL